MGNDILITKMGDPPGDACLYPENLPKAIITADCIKWTLFPILTALSFFVMSINSSLVRNQILHITKGVAQQKVSLQRFAHIAIPLPPLSEQQQIVSEAEANMSNIAKLEEATEHNLKRAELERQSILREAFAGRLVPQDPDDEPASVLLERIREERKLREEDERIIKASRKGERMSKAKIRKVASTTEGQVGLYEKLVEAGAPLEPQELFRRVGLEKDEQVQPEERFYQELDIDEHDGLIHVEKMPEKVLLSAIPQDEVEPSDDEDASSMEEVIIAEIDRPSLWDE